MFRNFLCILSALFVTTICARSQNITIDGVSNRMTYTDSVTLRVQTNAGFGYDVRLNGASITPGIFHTVNRMDYYDLTVRRVNDSTSEVTNVLVRFIVLSSQRGSPELGLIQWVPYPPTPSTAAEFAGARLHLVAPRDYPQGLEIPIVARIADDSDNERRANGWVSAPGFEASAFRILRGHGHGFLPPVTNGGPVNFNAQISALQTNKTVNIDTSTIWVAVSGILAGDNTWATNARIHVTGNLTVQAGTTLTIQEGAIVRLNPGVNITNVGNIFINGTTERPVVFTPTNRVAPEVHAGAWGGFVMRTPGATLIANGTIMTGSGAAVNFGWPSYASTHKVAQALLMLHSNSVARLTNCFFINNAGQIGNGFNSDLTLDHCLWQRAITAGEYVGGTIIINHSAVIEFPGVDGVYNATIADADYDAIYFTTGTHILQNSLFGFCKDDAIDSGSGGAGTVVVSNCWVESALHEALAWSGGGRRTWTYDTVLINNGQGIECGWSDSAGNSPLCHAERLFSTANSVGARYGDNYEGTAGLGFKDGFLTVTNSIILHNYRDVWGQVWDNTWNYRVNDMAIRDNFLTAPNTNHSNNAVWEPTADASKLAPFMTTPPNAPVGIGLALWNLHIGAADLTNGIPVRLSSFTTNSVSVDYAIETPSAAIANGTLTFTPGETVKHIFGNPAALGGEATWRVALRSPSGGELTGPLAAYALPALQQTNNPATTLITSNSTWKYLDDGSNQGTAWRGTNFNDSSWGSGAAQLGFGDGDEMTEICCSNAPIKYITAYFRKTFTVPNPAAFANLSMWLLRDDGAVAYLNEGEIFRSANMPGGTISYDTLTVGAAAENAPDTATLGNTLRIGTNVLAVEVHQQATDSSDLSFNFALTGNPMLSARLGMVRFGSALALYWNASGYLLEQADQVTGPWTFVASEGPATVNIAGPQKFFHLRKP